MGGGGGKNLGMGKGGLPNKEDLKEKKRGAGKKKTKTGEPTVQLSQIVLI